MFKHIELRDAIAKQTIFIDGEYKFICKDCKNWIKNTVGCKANCFISTVGCHIPECSNFIRNDAEVKDES